MKVEEFEASSEENNRAEVDSNAEAGTSANEPTFDGRWSSDENSNDGFPDSDNEPLGHLVKKKTVTSAHKKKTIPFLGNRGEYWR